MHRYWGDSTGIRTQFDLKSLVYLKKRKDLLNSKQLSESCVVLKDFMGEKQKLNF